MLLKRIFRLFIGFFTIATGTQLTLHSELGMNPWATFHQGVAMNTALSFGQVSQLTGLVIILLSLLIKIRPGIGTVLNMIAIGLFIDLISYFHLLPTATTPVWRIAYLIAGLIVFNYGIYIYLSAQLGAGPRDGLFVGLSKITGKTVTVIRPMIEVTVLLIGILLGATIGVGTVVNALLGGWILQRIFAFHKFEPKSKAVPAKI